MVLIKGVYVMRERKHLFLGGGENVCSRLNSRYNGGESCNGSGVGDCFGGERTRKEREVRRKRNDKKYPLRILQV